MKPQERFSLHLLILSQAIQIFNHFHAVNKPLVAWITTIFFISCGFSLLNDIHKRSKYAKAQ